MARAGVTYTEVAKAAETLKQQGQDPTIERVRGLLGTGSNSTLNKHLKQWKNTHLEEGSISGLPDDLLRTVKSLHESIQGNAELKIEEVTKELNAVIDDLRTKLTTAQEQNNELTHNNEQLTQQNEELSNQLEVTNKDNFTYQLKQEQLAQDVTRLTSELAEEKEGTKQLQAHIEHYQEKTAEDRQQERKQHQLALQQSQHYIDQLTSELSTLRNQEEQSSAAASNLEKENATLQQRLNENINKNEELNANLSRKASEVEKLIETKQKLQDDYRSAFAEKSVAEQTVEHLSVTLRKTESDLNDTKEKLSLVNEENKLVIQQKAEVQGQLNQLQNS